MKYKGDKHKTETLKFRLKTSNRLTEYFDEMSSESHIWINAGCKARMNGLSFIDCTKIATLVQNIPQAFVHGAINLGMEMKCSHVKYGEHTYPLYSAVPLGKKSRGGTVYFPKCGEPFELQKGTLPNDSQSYKIVDVSNSSDKERQFELHVTVRRHVPPRKMTGVWGGVDIGGRHSAVVVKSDGTGMILTLRESDTMRKIAKLHSQMSKCKKNSRKYLKLKAKMDSIYKKLGNRQLDKLRKFNKKLLTDCDRIVFEAIDLQKLTAEGGSHKKDMNRTMRQSKPGLVRQTVAESSLGYNVQYNEIRAQYTSIICSLCVSANTWRKSRKFKCFDCGAMMHADFNAARNILYSIMVVLYSKRAQRALELYYDKAGQVLRDKVDLRGCTLPPAAGDLVAGTGGQRQHLKRDVPGWNDGANHLTTDICNGSC